MPPASEGPSCAARATFFFARFWHRLLGDFSVRLLTRLLGLLVLAVGVQMIVSGVKEL